MFTFALILVTLLCLLFPPTRWISLIGIAVLLYLSPKVVLGICLILAVLITVFFIYKWRKSNGYPRLPY